MDTMTSAMEQLDEDQDAAELWVPMRPELLAEHQAELAMPGAEPEPGTDLTLGRRLRSLSLAAWRRTCAALRRRRRDEARRARARAGNRRARRSGRTRRRAEPARRPSSRTPSVSEEPAQDTAAPGGSGLNPAELPFLLLPREVAVLLRLSLRALYARIERGLVPGVVRDGRRVLVRRDDLLKALEKTRAASPGGRR